MITPLERWIAAKIGCDGRPLTPEALRSYQRTKLNETLALVQERSPFYRRLLGSKKISLSALDELADLPFSAPRQLAGAPLDFLCVRPGDVDRIVTLPTSGTTGPPKRIFFTGADQELTRDFFQHGMSTLVAAGDRVLILLPGSLPGSVGDLLMDGLARMGARGIPHGPVSEPRHTLELIETERVTTLVGIPVQVLGLARLAAAGQVKHRGRLKSVLLSTDRVPNAVVSAIESAWGCEVYNHYGTTEMGLGGGVDCQARVGYHLREADLLFEIIDPVTGRPAAEGEVGEVVFTTLTRTAMPLIRYRTGDLSRFIHEPCPCGTMLRRMAHVDERLGGGISLPGGEVVQQKDFDEALFPIGGLADFRVLFAQQGGRPTLTVEVKHGYTRTDPDRIIERLLTVRAVAAEVVRGGLSLVVRDCGAGEGNNTGTGKRQIVHLDVE